MICPQCNKEFNRSSNSQKFCSKECYKVHDRELDKIRGKKYRQSEKGKSTKLRNSRSLKSKKRQKEYQKNWLLTDIGKLYGKNYQQSEKFKNYLKSDSTKIKRSEYHKKKLNSDPLFKLTQNIRSRLGRFLKSRNIRKNSKTLEIIGCSPEFLKKHLEKQFHRHPKTFQPMNWKNHTVHGWHIDHIIPLDSAKNLEDVEKLMHYTNLQPLWAEYNIKKGNKII